MSETKLPNGIGAILTDDTGDVVAHHFDFDRSGYGGFKLWEAQRMRAKANVVRQYIGRYTYGPVADAIDQYHSEEIVRALINKKKLRMTLHRRGLARHRRPDQSLTIMRRDCTG